MSSDQDGNQVSEIEADQAIEDVSPAQRIGQLLQDRKFCEAAKLYSELTGSDLIESKLAIDRLARKHNLLPLSGCLSHLGLLVLLTGGFGWAIISCLR